MKNKIILLIIVANSATTYSQSKVGINTETPAATLDINGRMRVGDEPNNNSSPAGTIRFNPETGDFEGYDGNDWVPFTPDPRETFWPALGDRGATGSYYDYSPSDVSQGDLFGYSVDIHGSYAVIGSPGWNGGQGRVFVMKREPVLGFWNVVDTLFGEPSFPGLPSEYFGFSVAIYGDKIVVGCPYSSSPFILEEGVIKIYKRSGNQWNYLTGFGPANYCKELGFDVDIYENTIIAGCPQLCGTCTDPNFHYGAIFHEIDESGNLINWAPIAKFTSPTSVSRFGHAVAISGDFIAVSSPFSNPTPREDSVYIYKRQSGSTFDLNQVVGGNSDADSEFGYSLSMHGPKMLIGHRKRNTSGPDVDRGEAIMHYRDNFGVYQPTLNIIGQDTIGKLGHAVACSAIHDVVAAHEDINGFTTYIQSLKLLNGSFVPYVSITDPQATQWDHAVSDISVDGNYFIVGLAGGISQNGQPGGRVYFGKIR
jgi:hypothetical protein